MLPKTPAIWNYQVENETVALEKLQGFLFYEEAQHASLVIALAEQESPRGGFIKVLNEGLKPQPH